MSKSYFEPRGRKKAYNQQQTIILISKRFQFCVTIRAMPINSSFFDQVHMISTIGLLILNIKFCYNKDYENFKIVNDVIALRPCEY